MIAYKTDQAVRDTARSTAYERLAISAHEIRNPAQALIGLTDMLSGMALPPEAQACAKVIRQSAQAILAVVDDALDLARLREGVIAFVAEPFDPHAVISGTVEILYQQAAAKGLDLAGFSDPQVPQRVIGDAARLRQILLNLAGNAIKFTEEGGVGLALRRAEDGGLLFIVEDTGPGLADSERAALFTAFETGSHDQSGLGLGLAISIGIANALGGSISVEARAEGGSRFILKMPCPDLPDWDHGEAEWPSPTARRPVLIVSAAPFTGPYLAERLRALGHDVELIERPERAGLWIADRSDVALVVDAALGQRGLTVAMHRALAAGCQAIAILRALDEGQELTPFAGEFEWPVIRKPVTGRSTSLRIEAIGRRFHAVPREAGPVALIADDCPINRLLAARLLRQEGYRIVTAADGIEAVDLMAERLSSNQDPFSLILIDLSMPGLDGYLTTRQIRGVESLFLAPAAFIAGLSAFAEPETLMAARCEGMDDLVMKPLTPETLMRLRDAAQQKSVMQLSDICKKRVSAAAKKRR
jgi:CheY-like chemotaxis protein